MTYFPGVPTLDSVAALALRTPLVANGYSSKSWEKSLLYDPVNVLVS